MHKSNNNPYTYIINKSKFISYYFEVDSMDLVSKYLDQIKDDHKKSTHICYAYDFIDKDGFTHTKAHDANEPKGTAGYPILNLIQKKKVKNCLIIVVRYFGGTKLGKSVLLRSYVKSANEILLLNNK